MIERSKKEFIFAFFIFIFIVFFILFVTLIGRGGNVTVVDNKSTTRTTTTTERRKTDTSPNNVNNLLNDIVIYPHNLIPNTDGAKEMKDILLESLKEIDTKFLKAIWHSGGRIVITDGIITDIPELSDLRGQEVCGEHRCRRFEDINGIYRDNRAYVTLGISRFPVCTFDCQINRVGSLVQTLFHEVGHLIDYSMALRMQFSVNSNIHLSNTTKFKEIHNLEHKILFNSFNNQFYTDVGYFAILEEYFAESFYLYHHEKIAKFMPNPGINRTNILRDVAPNTYDYFESIKTKYQPIEI